MRDKYSVLINLITILKVTKIILMITHVKDVVDTDPQDENTAPVFLVAEGNLFRKLLTLYRTVTSSYTTFISFSSLSYDTFKASSKASSSHSAIQSFLLQMRVSSPFLKVIQ